MLRARCAMPLLPLHPVTAIKTWLLGKLPRRTAHYLAQKVMGEFQTGSEDSKKRLQVHTSSNMVDYFGMPFWEKHSKRMFQPDPSQAAPVKSYLESTRTTDRPRFSHPRSVSGANNCASGAVCMERGFDKANLLLGFEKGHSILRQHRHPLRQVAHRE